MKKTYKKPRWQLSRLSDLAARWLIQMKRKKSPVNEQSQWWDFLFYWTPTLRTRLDALVQGYYVFSPMQTYIFSHEQIVMWSYSDRLMVSLLLKIIRPLFVHIISRNCFHLKGPAGVKTALEQVTKALETNTFRYVIRIDIASYYASIDHAILQAQVASQFNDLRLCRYLNDIITIGIEKNGMISVPNKGIAVRSSLSPFFGALYLSPLDKAFEFRQGVFYARFMDDVLILTETKRQFVAAKKRLRVILANLKLKLSPQKTRMGQIKNEFHFLGVKFDSVQIESYKSQAVKFDSAQTESEKSQAVTVKIHPRSCRRALDKVRLTQAESGSPEKMQRYLTRWSAWWAKTVPSLMRADLILAWCQFTRLREPLLRWVGTGLLLGLPP